MLKYIILFVFVLGCQDYSELDNKADIYWRGYIKQSKLIDSLEKVNDDYGALRAAMQQIDYINNSPIEYWDEKYTNKYKNPTYWK